MLPFCLFDIVYLYHQSFNSLCFRLQSRLTNHTTLSHLVSSPLYNQVLEFFGKFQNSIDGTDSWFQTSARSYPSYEQFEGCPTTIWKKGGYNNALKLLMVSKKKSTYLLSFFLFIQVHILIIIHYNTIIIHKIISK